MKSLIALVLIVFLILVGSVSPVEAEDYQEGNWMLTSGWHQGFPYNEYCPEVDFLSEKRRADAGCTAIAAAQIMHYWAWPPAIEGTPSEDFVWSQMVDEADPHYDNEVAWLIHIVGEEAGMGYYWLWSFCSVNDMYDALEDSFSYSADFHVGVEPDEVISNLDNNRPVLLGYLAWPLSESHVIVIDGWKEDGDTILFHINNGDGNNWGSWQTLDSLSSFDNYIYDLRPIHSLGDLLAGNYPLDHTFPYRYFDQDATGITATFSPGQRLQFLPGVKVTSIGVPGSYIQFTGFPSLHTYLFTRGDLSKGIKITGGNVYGGNVYGGNVYLSNGGSIKFNR